MFLINKVRNKNNIQLYTYWNTLRQEKKAPHRFDVDPSQITSLLSEAFILEYKSYDDYSFRLAGTKVCKQFGRELKNNNFMDLWSLKDQQDIKNLMFCITTDAAVGVCNFTAEAENGHNIDYEMILLPLLHHDHSISRIIGTMVTNSQTYWLGTSPFQRCELQNITLFWPTEDKFLDVDDINSPTDNVVPLDQLDQADYKLITSENRQFRVYDGGKEA